MLNLTSRPIIAARAPSARLDRYVATLVGPAPPNDLIGTPLGLQPSVTQGIVSWLTRSVSEGDGVALRICFAIPSRTVQPVADRLIASAQ